jgi:3-isopropylmalate/(R)-2-methylmalate dehydratase small subunit
MRQLALHNHGVRALIAPSFADIFFGNLLQERHAAYRPRCRGGRCPVRRRRAVARVPGYRLHIDLAAQMVTTPEGKALTFEVDAHRKNGLLNGLDDVALTLERSDAIRSYEDRRRMQEPWLFTPQH